MVGLKANPKRTYANMGLLVLLLPVPDPFRRPLPTTSLQETLKHLQAGLVPSLVGSLLLSHDSRCTQGFVCASQEDLFTPVPVDVL